MTSLNGSQKVGGILGLVVGVALVPITQPFLLVLLAFTLWVFSRVLRVHAFKVVRRWLSLEPFVLGVLVLAGFSFPDADRWSRLLILASKASLSLCAMVVLTEAVAWLDLLKVLRSYKVPPFFISTLELMSRYLVVFRDEARRMKNARRSRSFCSGKAHYWHLEASVGAQLFIRALNRSERIYAALCARGWNVSGD